MGKQQDLSDLKKKLAQHSIFASPLSHESATWGLMTWDELAMCTTSADPASIPPPLTMADIADMMREVAALPKPASVLICDHRFKAAMKEQSLGGCSFAAFLWGLPVVFFSTLPELLNLLRNYGERVVRIAFADGRDIEGAANRLRELLVNAAMTHEFKMEP